jgi:hypothetical protein
MIRRSVPGNHVLGNFLRQGLPLRQTSAKRLDKTFVALTALGLSRRLCCVGQWGGNSQPEPHKQRQRLVRDGGVAFKPLDLSGQSIEPATKRRLHPFRAIRRQI